MAKSQIEDAIMTTYGFNLSLDEQEFWAIKEAMEFYITNEATELRNKNPHLVKYAASIKLKGLLSSDKLYKGVQTISTNSFGHISNQNYSIVDDNISLFSVVVQHLKSNPHLQSLAETPIRDMFIEHPKLSELIRACLINCVNTPNQDIGLECNQLLKNQAAMEIFCSQIGKELYRLSKLSHPI
jgi:hypothetical protein